jgi:DNA processing protein
MAPTRFAAFDAPEEFAACQRIADALLPPHRVRALLRVAEGSPAAALALPTDVLRGPAVGLTEKQAARLAEAVAAPLPKGMMENAAALGAWAALPDDPAYPVGLAPLSDAPALLFVCGDLLPEDVRSVAIVGSRRATGYGRGQADRFARVFSEYGLTVVSGGAAGIDTAAHRAALNAGGRTLAVLGCGIDVSYPAENRQLFEQIAERGGAVISEFAMSTKPEPWRFPTRNRIIAGIAQVTLVIESPEGSGALLTATDAARYGRDVWAVPGAADNGRSRGCHRLIQEGAGLADAPEDVLSALGEASAPAVVATPSKSPRPKAVTSSAAPAPPLPLEDDPPPPAPLPPLTPDEGKLLAEFGAEPRHLDTAGERAGLSAPQATVAATLLEMKSLVKRLPGSLYVRA